MGEAYFPRWGGDVALDLSTYGSGAAGTSFTEALLHEIGHAIGLKHPFKRNFFDTSTVLPASQDNKDHTVMSYNYGPSGTATALGSFDVQAAQYIYGSSAAKDAWPIRYSYDARSGAVRMDARAGDLGIVGTDYRDAVYGTAGDKAISTGAGDDLIHAGAGSHTINAGTGRDTVELGTTRRRAALDVRVGGGDPGGWTDRQGSFSAPGESGTFAGVERIAFLDGHFSYTAEDPDAQVARLYRAGLGRTPDSGGLAYWGEQVAAGTPLVAVAQGIAATPEYQARLGGLDSGGFVAQIHRDVLGREADAGGFSYWQSRLLAGRGRAEVLVGLSESAENKRATASLVAGGLWVQDREAASVARLYDAALDRRPDGGGLATWSAQLDAGASLRDVAARFIATPEFQARYGGLDAAGFVRAMYQNVLDRPADAGGVDHWAGLLDAGRTDRAGVLASFSESQEHRVALAPLIDDGIVLA